jgi:hypothetical protein
MFVSVSLICEAMTIAAVAPQAIRLRAVHCTLGVVEASLSGLRRAGHWPKWGTMGATARQETLLP